MSARLSNFARSLSVETAFTVLALARSLKAAGKDVVELEIGDSPFDSTAAARAGGMDAIKNNQSHYCPSPGLPTSGPTTTRRSTPGTVGSRCTWT